MYATPNSGIRRNAEQRKAERDARIAASNAARIRSMAPVVTFTVKEFTYAGTNIPGWEFTVKRNGIETHIGVRDSLADIELERSIAFRQI